MARQGHPVFKLIRDTLNVAAGGTVADLDLGSGCVVPGHTANPAVPGAEGTPHHAVVQTDDRTIDLRLTYRSTTGRYWRITTDGTVERAPASSGP